MSGGDSSHKKSSIDSTQMQQPSILSSLATMGKGNSRGGNHIRPPGSLGASFAISTLSGDTTISKTSSTIDKGFLLYQMDDSPHNA